MEDRLAGNWQAARGAGRGVIKAPSERVFRALTDYGHRSEFMPFLQKSAASPQPDCSIGAAQVMKLPVRRPVS